VLVMGVSEGAPDTPAPYAGMAGGLLLKTDEVVLDSELAEPMLFTRSPGEMTWGSSSLCGVEVASKPLRERGLAAGGSRSPPAASTNGTPTV